MKKYLGTFLLMLTVIFSAIDAEAQRFTARKKYWSIGGSVNAMNYMGDITPSKNPASIDFIYTRPNIGIEVMRRMSPRVSVRGQYFWGRIKGDDWNNSRPGHSPALGDNGLRYGRNQAFRNDIMEVSVMGIFDLYENRGTFLKRPDYTPYAMVGLSGFYHSPSMYNTYKRIDNYNTTGELEKLDYKDMGTYAGDGGSKVQGALLYGLGFRYKLAKQWDIALEMGWRLTLTDKLDGVYGDYDDPANYGLSTGTDNQGTWRTASTAYKQHNATGFVVQEGEKKGETGGFMDNDSFLVTGIHLTYILTGKVVCPKFR